MKSEVKPEINSVLREDLDSIFARTEHIWPLLRDQTLFITGGTGFFGTGLLFSFADANRRLKLNARAVVLSRNPEAFKARFPELTSDPALHFHRGDLESFTFPEDAAAFILHAAVAGGSALDQSSPTALFDSILKGSEQILSYARTCQSRGKTPKILFTSSGAVYGKQSPETAQLREEDAYTPDPTQPASGYAEGKRASELLFRRTSHQSGIPCTIARCFAFMGPFIPLNDSFAAGNFIRDGLAGHSIQVQGDGLAQRSYLYTADLITQLWTLLLVGKSEQAYNIGSEDAVTIRELAEHVGKALQVPVEIAGKTSTGIAGNRYIPSTEKIRKDFGLEPTLGLAEMIARTVQFYQASSSQGAG